MPDRPHPPLAVDGNGELHDPRAIDFAPHSLVPPLRCADCGAALEAVRSYARRDGSTIVHVGAHYRLAPGAGHAEQCPSRHAAEDPAVTRAAPRRHPLTPAYSIVVPERRRPHPSTNGWRTRSGPLSRTPALNSAAKVADLLQRHGDDAPNIRLTYRGQPLAWERFLYRGEDVDRLVQQLHEARVAHPVAILGKVARIGTARSGESHYAALRNRGRGGATAVSRIVLRARHKPLLDEAEEGDFVVALGWPRPHPQTRSDVHPVQLTLWINHRWQISVRPKPPPR